MADYKINGSDASLAPVSQQWIDIPLGTNLQGKTIFYPRKEVVLTFDSCSMTFFHQWADVANAGSLNTLTMLDPASLNYTGYSNVYLDLEQRPLFEAGVAMGPWSLRVREVEIS
jgi:hypothetical protein